MIWKRIQAGTLLCLGAISIFAPTAEARWRTREVEIIYSLAVKEIPEGAKRVSAWVPIPLSSRWQSVKGMEVEGIWPHEIVREPDLGNRFIRLDLSRAEGNGSGDRAVTVTFHIVRKPAGIPRFPDEKAKGTREPTSTPHRNTGPLPRFLSPNRLVPINGPLADEAVQVTQGIKEPLERARLLFENIVATLRYDKSGSGWGRGDALYACSVRAGNCTDFHSLFIAEARSLGIPARFIMGLPLPEMEKEGEIPGYHCWAEFYTENHGWLPVDASEAHKHRKKKEDYFARLDPNRVAFTIGRDISIPGASGEPLNYVIFPYVEVDGKPHDNVKILFGFRDI